MTFPIGTPGAPLAGYRVLDLTTFLSGPFATQVLADMGAEVVKIEPPNGGDSSRTIPPYFVEGDSAYFLGINRSKRSIALDLKSPHGVALLKEMIAVCDVVVENYRPGVAARMGLDSRGLRAHHPRLIWASISGFGQTGPWKDHPAYDMIVQALSGVMSLTGEAGRPSVRLGIPAGDIVAGMYASIAINAALADRERTGKGRAIDISMLDCQLAMLSYQSTYALVAGITPQPQGAKHDSIPTYRSFVGEDGRELVVTANTERMWRGMCSALGCAELADDARFCNAHSRLAHRNELWPILEAAFRTKPAADWIEPLQSQGVPVALIKKVPEALADAREAGRGMVMQLEDLDGRSVEVVGNPIKLQGESPLVPRYPPRLGEGAHQVLASWLGKAERDVDLIVASGALQLAHG
ncbi:CaiB/BaiF CoA transferase family protein [Variovorax sp. RA8]|uniref:CaiB/BaiF CoA transferase family protein n=1 Tax=Variovorax sp. (strain JCM 16519 / RA8) TaxID=662548 RepID=UPI0013174945|nr:CoA transferase [Variovorax sp. RA8]VTU28637.1 Formyl-coenzyme A transferase [Variovorax sp. RA8]